MFTGLKAFGSTVKMHWGWALIILAVLAIFGLGILQKISDTVMGLPVIGPLASRARGVGGSTAGA